MGKRKENKAALSSTSEAEAEFKRQLHAGNVILSPGAKKALKETGLTIDDVIASMLKDLKGLQ